MTDFEIFQEGFTQGWASQQDVHDATALGIITTDEYQTIIGSPYVA